MSGRLRSLHLAPETSSQAIPGGTNPVLPTSTQAGPAFDSGPEESKYRPRNGVIPIDVATFVLLGLVLSLFFIGAISAAFAGATEDTPHLNDLLREVAQTNPGVGSCGSSVGKTTNNFVRLCCWAKALTSMSMSPLSPSAGQSWHADRA